MLRSEGGPWGVWVRTPVGLHGLGVLDEARALGDRAGVKNLVFELGPPGAGVLSWSAAARGAATDVIHTATEWAVRTGWTVCLRPEASHLISDVPSTLAALRSHSSLRLALEQAALLTDSMLPQRAQHMERLRHAFGQHSQLGCVMVADAGIEADVAGFAAITVWAARGAPNAGDGPRGRENPSPTEPG